VLIQISLTIFIAGFLVPILLSLLRFIPISRSLTSRFRAYLIYPLVWNRQRSVGAQDTGDTSPTWGQLLFIFWMLIINAVLSSTGHFTLSYHYFSFDGRHGQFITCLANRLGGLSLANIPLLFLYSGRNNVLLKITSMAHTLKKNSNSDNITDWSHSTFIMLHRWLGYITVGEAIIHSLLYLRVAVAEGKLNQWSTMEAWYCGSIATVALSLIIPFSVVAIRRRAYEFFLLTHIALSVFALVGAYYHISDLFNTKWAGYTLYLWFAVCFWGFDRLSRIVRVLLNGVTKATITVIDEEYIRVDIPNAKAYGHAYLYFPTLTYRFWENHPFSVVTSSTSPHSRTSRNISPAMSYPLPIYYTTFTTFNEKSRKNSYSSNRTSTKSNSPTFEFKSKRSFSSDETYEQSLVNSLSPPRTPITPMTPDSAYFPCSLSPTFSNKSCFTSNPTSPVSPLKHRDIEKSKPAKSQGLTFFMRTHSGTTGLLRKRASLPVLVEASYGKPKNLDTYPLLLCIAGGVGITAILPYLYAHKGRTKLFWGSRSTALVSALREETRGFEGKTVVGKRLFIKVILKREFAKIGDAVNVAVVVSGPKGMGHEVRKLVCEIAKKRVGEVRLVDENFGW
jgi:hypothetical protein